MAARRPAEELPLVVTIGRQEFVTRRWDPRPGDHVSFIGPTGCGKTQLGLDLLDRSTGVELPGIILATKPRDATIAAATKRLNYRLVRNWPPADQSRWHPRKPRGWTVWPKHTFDTARDNEHMSDLFGRVIMDSYKRGGRVLFADEVYELCAELGLEKELVAVWSRGRSMGCGLWAATQRPSHVPLWMYSQAEHLFLHKEPDKRARERYKEIGGVNPDLIEFNVMRMTKHQFLYVRRRDEAMCIVDKD